MSRLWAESLALILTPSCVIVVLGLLGRSATRQFLDGNLEGYKAALSASSELQLENLKAELHRVTYEHSVVFGRLHAERAEAVRSLYQKARNAAKTARRFAAGEGVSNADEFQASRGALEAALNDLNQAVFENRIFLPEHLCVKIEQRLQEITQPASEIAGGYVLPLRPDMERFNARLADKRKVEEATWRLEAEIANEFRTLLGVK